MTIKYHKLGAGTLTVGAGPLAIAQQVVEATVKWTETLDTVDAVDVLSGEQLPAEETPSYRAELVLKVLQDDLAAAGMIDYSWTNKGTSQPVVFVPNTAAARKITGTVRVVPIDVGGTVKQKNTSDVTWPFTIGSTPALAATP